MKIIYAFADHPGEGNCSNWLCAFPVTALDRAGHDASLMHISEFVEERPLADIIVVERLLWNGCDPVKFDGMPDGPTRYWLQYFANLKVLDTIEWCQSKGCKVIAIFDDHYGAYPKTPGYEIVRSKWIEGKVGRHDMGFDPFGDFRVGLGLVDAAMATSKYLCAFYGQYAKRMYYVHNRPLLSMYSVANNAYRPGGRLMVGWSGTAQHLETWIDHPLLDVLAELRDDIVVVGIIPGAIVELLVDRGVEVQSRGVVDIEHFPSVVATYDIGICPLQGEFDLGRSWIKWLECSLMGKPVVGQWGQVYEECEGGYWANTANEWKNGIIAMKDENTYLVTSQQGRAWAWAQDWDSNLTELTDIFEAVL